MFKKISIIILAYNDSNTIKKCIKSVISQVNISKYQIEIIFVPNGCTDNTADIGKETLAESKVSNITHETCVLENGHRNKALNFGINKSTGGYILYLNGDCYLASDSVSLVVKELSKGALLVGCKDICLPDNIQTNSLLHKYVLAYGESQRYSRFHLPNGRCIGFHKGFIESFPEDIHSEDNWIGFHTYKKHGYEKIKKAGEVYYQLPSNWSEIVSQFTRYVLGTKQVINKFPELKDAFINVTTKEYSQTEKENGIIDTQKKLESLGYTKDTIQQLLGVHKFIKTITDDNASLQQNPINNDGTWITDR